MNNTNNNDIYKSCHWSKQCFDIEECCECLFFDPIIDDMVYINSVNVDVDYDNNLKDNCRYYSVNIDDYN